MGERKDCDVNNDVVSSGKRIFLVFQEHFPLGKLFCVYGEQTWQKQTNKHLGSYQFSHLSGIEKKYVAGLNFVCSSSLFK